MKFEPFEWGILIGVFIFPRFCIIGSDIIIAKFFDESRYRYWNDKYLDELMNRLESKGFVGRSRRAVSTRANWYLDFIGRVNRLMRFSKYVMLRDCLLPR